MMTYDDHKIINTIALMNTITSMIILMSALICSVARYIDMKKDESHGHWHSCGGHSSTSNASTHHPAVSEAIQSH